jgi:hypothetical protein
MRATKKVVGKQVFLNVSGVKKAHKLFAQPNTSN